MYSLDAFAFASIPIDNPPPESHFTMPRHRRRDMTAPTRPLRLLTILGATLLASAALLIPATAASAADIPGAITSVATDKTSYGYNERIALTFNWAVPDSAASGDTFSLELPEQLKAVSQAKFALQAPDGSVVANAVWNGKSVVFTLTDYVDSHDSVAGSGFLTAQWDHAFTPETSQPVTLQFSSNAVNVVIGAKPTPTPPCTQNCPPPPSTPTSRGLSKSGSWADGAFEGTRDTADNINWTIALPGNATGYPTPIRVVDSPADGSVVDCGTITLTTQGSLASGATKTSVDPSRYTVRCSPSGFEIDLDTIAPSEFMTIRYQGTITNQLSRSYANHVAVTIAGQTAVKDTTIKRTDAGGIGGGVQSVAVGDVVWLDSDGDGIQDPAEKGIGGVTLGLTGPDGKPVTSVGGATVGPVVTDAAGHYQFANLPVLPAGQHYTVTVDTAASSTALTGLVPALAHVGGDATVDSSTGSAESAELTTNGARDESLDFGFVSPALPELPTLALPDPGSAAAPTQLAHTGSEGLAAGLLAAIAAIALGAAGAVAAKRRRA